VISHSSRLGPSTAATLKRELAIEDAKRKCHQDVQLCSCQHGMLLAHREGGDHPQRELGLATSLIGEKAQGSVGARLQVDLDPARPTGNQGCSYLHLSWGKFTLSVNYKIKLSKLDNYSVDELPQNPSHPQNNYQNLAHRNSAIYSDGTARNGRRAVSGLVSFHWCEGNG